METALARLVGYRCPGCGSSLEVLAEGWRDWARCPACGRPSRPPPDAKAVAPIDEVTFLDPVGRPDSAPRGPGAMLDFGPAGPSQEGPGGTWKIVLRVALLVGLFVAVVGTLLMFGRQDPGRAAVYGFVALLLLIFLVVSSRKT